MQWVMHNVQIAELTYIAAQLGTHWGMKIYLCHISLFGIVPVYVVR